MADSPEPLEAPPDPWKQKCLLCKEPLLVEGKELTDISETFIENAIKSSKIRGEPEVAEYLENKTSVRVHLACTKSYNSQKALKAAAKKLKSEQSSSVSTRSTNDGFDFKNNCFYCAKSITNSHKLVSYVTRLKYKEKLLKDFGDIKNVEAEKFKTRISSVNCLKAEGAAYHRNCAKTPHFVSKKLSISHESCDVKENAVDFIIDYINKSDENQFALKDIITDDEVFKDLPTFKYIKTKLEEHFKNDCIVQIVKDDLIISKISLARLLLARNYTESKIESTVAEQLKRIDESSALITKDINGMNYDSTHYPAQDKFLEGSDLLVPEKLRRCLFNIIAKNKEKPDDWADLVNSIAHAIIAAAKPKKFLSPVLVNIAVVLHRMYGSKELIDLLHANGLCASYEEVRRYLSSVIEIKRNPQQNAQQNSGNGTKGFTQIVYDNADHNTDTSDGKNTFHVMGGIQITTPASAVTDSSPIPRLRHPLTSAEMSEIGTISLKRFNKVKEGGFKNIELQDINAIHQISEKLKVSKFDFYWLYGRSQTENVSFPGFNGFMEKLTENDPYEISKIKILPFINHEASKHNTIYTALLEAERIRLEENQAFMFVTFDSPLFWKSHEVITHVQAQKHITNINLDRIILRLGGFHLWFSYTSSIDYIMKGSGLRELFCEIFAENSCEKVLNGTAYSRSVRDHLMVHAALGALIMKECDFTEEEKVVLNYVTSKQGPQLKEFLDDKHFESAYKKFHLKLDGIENRGPTAKLWVLYFKLLTIMKLFIQAEKSGDFDLHLETCHRMLPILLATGHFQYVRCLLLYLQQMVNLYQKLKNNEFEGKEKEEIEKFIKHGFFTIRRLAKFWAGVWADMTIEQGLMRLMKTRGGLTRGRGVTHSVQNQWTSSTPATVDLSEQLQNYSKVNFSSSEQHKDARKSRMKSDYEDLIKILNFFKRNNPFPFSEILVSLSTGIVGNKTVNCHETLQKGSELLIDKLQSTHTFDKLSFKKKDLVISIQAGNAKVDGDKNFSVTANATLIFQRIAGVITNKATLLIYLQYELAPWPPALFENGTMRKTNKAKFVENFNQIAELPSGKKYFVIDGGYLLMKVVWEMDTPKSNDTSNQHNTNPKFKPKYKNITEQYINYLNKFREAGCQVKVIFDGYATGTKSAERTRRKAKGIGRQINVTLETSLSSNQTDFFNNEQNKIQFISMLKGVLTENEIAVDEAPEDADTLIVENAINLTTIDCPAVIVGSDTDLLVIMTQRTPIDKKVYFLKDDKGTISYYDSDSIKNKDLKHLVLFLHAFTGCDTTSAFFNQGKNGLLKILEKNEELAASLAIFNNPNATHQQIADAGNQAIKAMYGAKRKQNMTLNEFRYYCYKKSLGKRAFALKYIPPSESAAAQHSYRVYHQIQSWFNTRDDNDRFLPTNWGWTKVENMDKTMYKAVFVTGPLVPAGISKTIKCNCKKECKKTCTCVKHGLKCSEICGHCKGHSCCNKQDSTDLPGDEEENCLIENKNAEDEESNAGITYDIPEKIDSDNETESEEDDCVSDEDDEEDDIDEGDNESDGGDKESDGGDTNGDIMEGPPRKKTKKK